MMRNETIFMLYRITLAASFVMMVMGGYGVGVAMARGNLNLVLFCGGGILIGALIMLRTLLVWNRSE